MLRRGGHGYVEVPGSPPQSVGKEAWRSGQPSHGRPGVSMAPWDEGGKNGKEADSTVRVRTLKDGHTKVTDLCGPCPGPLAGVLSSWALLSCKAAHLPWLGPAS